MFARTTFKAVQSFLTFTNVNSAFKETTKIYDLWQFQELIFFSIPFIFSDFCLGSSPLFDHNPFFFSHSQHNEILLQPTGSCKDSQAPRPAVHVIPCAQSVPPPPSSLAFLQTPTFCLFWDLLPIATASPLSNTNIYIRGVVCIISLPAKSTFPGFSTTFSCLSTIFEPQQIRRTTRVFLSDSGWGLTSWSTRKKKQSSIDSIWKNAWDSLRRRHR